MAREFLKRSWEPPERFEAAWAHIVTLSISQIPAMAKPIRGDSLSAARRTGSAASIV